MRRRALAVAAALLAAHAPAAAQDAGVTLVRCGERGESACLHTAATLRPEVAGRLAPGEHAGAWRIRHGGAEAGARPAAVPRRATPPLRLLVLVDVSGSMRDGGLQTARSALRSFLSELPGESVRAAVVPFASARVAERIQGARFVPAPQAAAQVEALPAPDGNTGLYSALRAGLERLGAEPAPGDSAWNAVLLVTDGRNDVGKRGDDPGLLQGGEGRRAAVDAVRASGAYAWVVGIGPGLDAAELRALAAPRGEAFAVAEDPVALRRALGRIQGWIFTGREFLVPVAGAAEARLAGGPAQVSATAGGARAGGRWTPPVFALPAFQGRSAAAVQDVARADSWRVRRGAVFTFFAGVLLVLWTAVPPLLRAPVPAPRLAPRAEAAKPADAPTGTRRIRLRAGPAALAVAAVPRPELLSEAPPRKPTDVTAKVSRPLVQRT